MVDLGFVGPKFTWNHGSDAAHRRSARLDKDLANTEWQQRFAEASLTHYTHAYSDHCPLLRTTPVRSSALGERPFIFEATWLSDRRFMEFVEANWNKNIPLHAALNCFTAHVRKWNKEVFGGHKTT